MHLDNHLAPDAFCSESAEDADHSHFDDVCLRALDRGIDGIALTWLDYHQGIKDFVAGVQPLMEAAGLREPFLSDASPVLNEAREAVEMV